MDPLNENSNENSNKIFNKTDLFVNPTDSELPYRRRNDEEKKAVHHGQRKLLLTLVQFLTLFWNPKKNPKPVVVYAGAAPGTNIGIVSMLFPEIEFHLYDPSPFKIKASDKIHLYQQFFTDDDAKKWSGRNDVYFISDIRTADYTKSKNLDDNEEQIMKDMEMQMKWFVIINPVEGHLKFRPPYTGGNRPERINYLYGYVFHQPWSPRTTTESRLVPTRNNEGLWMFVSWSAQKYQDQMFYHNVIVRETYTYKNPFFLNNKSQENNQKNVDYPELLNDYDSLLETQIWIDYLNFRSGNYDKASVIALSRLITDKLSKGSKHKDTLELLRSNPMSIKYRNVHPSRDDIKDNWEPVHSHIQPEPRKLLPNNNILKEESPSNNEKHKLAHDIGL